MDLENMFDVNGGGLPAEDIKAGEGSTASEGASTTPDTGAGDNEKKVQDEDANRLAAAARRKAESEFKAYRDGVDAFYRQNGYEGFDDYRQKYEQEQRRRAMEEAPENLGFSGSDIDPMVRAIVSEMPEFKAAKELAEENLKTQQSIEFEKQLKLISELDPNIKTADDLAGMENADKFNDLVFNNGLSLVDAFRFVNMDRLLQQNEARARQDALNKVNSKSHLSPVSGALTETEDVPEDVKAQYRAYFPGISDEKMREHYKKNHV